MLLEQREKKEQARLGGYNNMTWERTTYKAVDLFINMVDGMTGSDLTDYNSYSSDAEVYKLLLIFEREELIMRFSPNKRDKVLYLTEKGKKLKQSIKAMKRIYEDGRKRMVETL